jgi:hypothetical protein
MEAHRALDRMLDSFTITARSMSVTWLTTPSQSGNSRDNPIIRRH